MDIRQWVTNFQDIKDVIDTVEYEVRALELNKIRTLFLYKVNKLKYKIVIDFITG